MNFGSGLPGERNMPSADCAEHHNISQHQHTMMCDGNDTNCFCWNFGANTPVRAVVVAKRLE